MRRLRRARERGHHHSWELAKAAARSTLIGVGSGLSTAIAGTTAISSMPPREGVRDSLSNTGRQFVRHQLNVQPILTTHPGFPVRVVVNRDLVLASYTQEAKR